MRWHPDGPATTTLARVPGRSGELLLRERSGHYEIISNGTFLMDTRAGDSERQLVRRALDTAPTLANRRVLIGGLGVGFSLAEALDAPDVTEIVVIEVEPDVVVWNRDRIGARTGGRVDDPRVRCEVADLAAWLQQSPDDRFHAVCIDVDNGPRWTVDPANRWLYQDGGIRALRERLFDHGVLSVWSSGPDTSFERRLRRRFSDVRLVRVPVARAEPDVIYLATR